MKNFLRLLLFCGALLFFASGTSAQVTRRAAHSSGSVVGTMLRGSGKAVVILVGSAAKVAWVTTKFAVGSIAAPVAKTIFVRAAPRMGMFALRQSKPLLKKALPLAVKLSIL